MRDLENFQITRGAAAAVTLPQYTVSGTVVDSATGATIRTFNANFWTQFNNLAADRQDAIIAKIVLDLLAARGVTA